MELALQAREIMARELGEEHKNTLYTDGFIAFMKYSKVDFESLQNVAKRNLEIYRRRYGEYSAGASEFFFSFYNIRII